MIRRFWGWGLLVIVTGATAWAQEPLLDSLKDPNTAWLKGIPAPAWPFPEGQQFHGALKDLSGSPLLRSPNQKGKWWSNPQTAEALGLTSDQVKKMDDIFQQHRLKLIDLNAALEKEEAILEPLVSAEPPDDNKVLAQIDRVAQARAELEKANSRLLWSIRRVLTPEQWKKLQAYPAKPRKI
ncbi:MAG TPA: Spy/CpxP family protein refolding chaperone [Bryobacteraceae bacterium]|nr:Spy/CpxP family protein refolding chaperone [Bryobacteraceae bacterium]